MHTILITGGGRADTYVVFAMTDKTKGNKGLSAFIIESSFPGFSVIPKCWPSCATTSTSWLCCGLLA